jgi:myosin heavy subunit
MGEESMSVVASQDLKTSVEKIAYLINSIEITDIARQLTFDAYMLDRNVGPLGNKEQVIKTVNSIRSYIYKVNSKQIVTTINKHLDYIIANT